MAKSTIPQRNYVLKLHGVRLNHEDVDDVEEIKPEQLADFEFCRNYLDTNSPKYMGLEQFHADQEAKEIDKQHSKEEQKIETASSAVAPTQAVSQYSNKDSYLKSIYETSTFSVPTSDLDFTPEEQIEQINNRNYRESLRQKLRPTTQSSIDRQEGQELYMELLAREDINNFFDDHKSAFYKLTGNDFATAKDYREARLKEWGQLQDPVNSYIQERILAEATEIAKQAMASHHVALDIEESKCRQQNHPELALQLDHIAKVEKKLFAYKDNPTGTTFQDLIGTYKDMRKEEIQFSIPNSVDSPTPKVVPPELVLKLHQEERQKLKATEAERMSQPYHLTYTPTYELDKDGKKVARLSVSLNTKEGEKFGPYVCNGLEPDKNCRAWIKSTIADKEQISPEQVVFTKGAVLGVKMLSIEEAYQRKQDKIAKRQNILPAVDQYKLDDLIDFAQQYKAKGQAYISEEVSKQLYEGRTTAHSPQFLEKLREAGVPFLPEDDYKKLSNLQDLHADEYAKMKAQQQLLSQLAEQSNELEKRGNVPSATISLKNSELYYESGLQDKKFDKKIEEAGIPILSHDIYLACKDFEKKQAEKKAQEVKFEDKPSIKQKIGSFRLQYNR